VKSFAQLPADYQDFLRICMEEKVDFVVVGGWAVAAHGYDRTTKDLDVFVRADATNAPRVIRAVTRFGAPLHDLTVSDFAEVGVVFQIGAALRIDVTTTIEGVSFDDAVADPITVPLGDSAVRVIGLDALLRNKRAAGRLIDRNDVRVLERRAAFSPSKQTAKKAAKKAATTTQKKTKKAATKKSPAKKA
jgi:hypothetical protein